VDFYYQWQNNNKRVHIVLSCSFLYWRYYGTQQLCSIHGGRKGKFPCRLCWTKMINLDNPATIPISTMKNSESIKNLVAANPSSLKSLGYYACSYSILYDLQYCNPGGLNISLPPDILHAVLLGNITRLINGFSLLKKIDNESKYVFSDAYKGEIA